jgi:glycosyltransferase involved in cell wall biosynthesis
MKEYQDSLGNIYDEPLPVTTELSFNWASMPIEKEILPIQLTIVNQFFPPDYAATGQLIEELAHQLKGNFSALEVFSSQPSYAFAQNDLPRWEHHPDIRIRRSRSARVGYARIRGKALSGVIFCLRAVLHLLRHAPRRQLVLLTTAPPFLPLVGYFFSRFCKISYVCLLYDLYPDIAVELEVIKNNHWFTRLWAKLNQLAWKKAAAIIVLNSTMKDRIIKKCPAIANKIFIIPNWSDPQRIAPIPKHDNWFAREHGLVDHFTVMYSGNMGRCHDMKTLLDAIIILQDTSIKFVFIGGGDKRSYLQNKIKELNLRNCLFLPYQPKENLPFSLTAGDLSIVSIDERMEGLVVPSKLYSALAAATPIAAICPAHSYLNDIFDTAKCGATFRNGDGDGLATYIYQLSQNPQLGKELGLSGREYCIDNYTLEKVAQSYLKLLSNITHKKKVKIVRKKKIFNLV